MIKPMLQGQALLASILQAERDQSHFHLWWLGQSGFLLSWQGKRLLFDPYLSDTLTKKYAETDKPHVRMTELVIAPGLLPRIDVITSTHNHTDHLDAETLIPILSHHPEATLVIPKANRDFVAERLKCAPTFPTGMDAGETRQIGPFQFHAVPAAHELMEKDQYGRCKFLGYVAKFGPWTVYHSGDTVRYDGMLERLRTLEVDLALLPINGRAPERRVAGNLNGQEAAIVAKEAGARLAIPCHFEMFEFNTASPDLFIQTAHALGQPYKVLRAGEHWSSECLA